MVIVNIWFLSSIRVTDEWLGFGMILANQSLAGFMAMPEMITTVLSRPTNWLNKQCKRVYLIVMRVCFERNFMLPFR